METNVEFAILAPVPEEHLLSGLELLKQEDFVAFGSLKWEFFPKVDAKRAGQPVPVLIYPSAEQDEVSTKYVIQWVGWYLGHVRSDNGMHPNGETNRPESTQQYKGDRGGFWAVYWHVQKLRLLNESEFRPISSLKSEKTGQFWKSGSPPRGPELVARPDWI